MIYIILNIIPIAIAMFAGLAIGLIYALLMSHRAPRPAMVLTAAIAEFWLASILAGALILAPPKGDVWTMTLGSAFVIWIGFVVPVILTSYRFRTIPMRSALSDTAHWLAVMLVQAVVLRVVGLVPPPV